MEKRFKYAEGKRVEITNRQEKVIKNMYKECMEDIAKESKFLEGKDNISSSMRKSYLDGLSKQIEGSLNTLSKDLESEVKGSLLDVSNAVISDNAGTLKGMGFQFNSPFSHVSNEVVKDAVSGNMYKGKWTLSSAIWTGEQKNIDDIHSIVAKGITLNKSAYDIAKDLEKYVDPSKAKDWNWSKVYPGTNKVIDFNAQRLARTLVSHVYQESFVRSTKNNPFFDAYRWNHSNSDRVCPICKARSSDDSYGLGGGIFPKDKLVFDHPMGMCFFTVVMSKDIDEVIDDIANWYHGTGSLVMDNQLDKFANELSGVKAASGMTIDKIISQYGTSSSKHVSYWQGKLAPEHKEIVKRMKDESGLTWQKWYDKNIYKAKPIKTLIQPQSVRPRKPIPNPIGDLQGKPISAMDYAEWIGKMANQTESGMLSTENISLANWKPEQINSAKTYSGNSYRSINEYLRKIGKGMSPEKAVIDVGISDTNLKVIDTLKDALSNTRTAEDLYLRRGSNIGELAGLLDGNFRDNRKELMGMSIEELNKKFKGTIGTMEGFTSTSSLYKRGFSGDVEVIYKAPAGTAASSIMSISEFGTGEGETLLNAGTRIKVLSVEKSDGHKGSDIRIFMEILK